MDAINDETVWCDAAGTEVPACGCGPHEECPEHLLNCLMILEWNRRVRGDGA
jgi:hypothetical protein